jgi:hypothetical protein
MQTDIRLPIGGLFGLIGLLLVVYGIATGNSSIYERSLGVNVNFWWGSAMLIFGAAMLWFGAHARKK